MDHYGNLRAGAVAGRDYQTEQAHAPAMTRGVDKPPSGIESEMRAVAEGLSALDSRIANLRDRLVPVSSPKPSGAGEPQATPEPVRSPLAGALADFYGRISAMTFFVEGIERDLDI